MMWAWLTYIEGRLDWHELTYNNGLNMILDWFDLGMVYLPELQGLLHGTHWEEAPWVAAIGSTRGHQIKAFVGYGKHEETH